MMTVQYPGIESTQGLNWYTEDLFTSSGTVTTWGHNGGEQGVSTDIYLDIPTQTAICVLTNGEGDALYICDELWDYSLGLSPSGVGNPACANPLAVAEPIMPNLSISPNPSADIFNVEFDAIDVNISVYSVDGKLINSAIASSMYQLDLSKEKSGIYFIRLESDAGVRTERVVKI